MKYKRIILLLICAWFVSCSGGDVGNETEDPDDQIEIPDDQTEDPDDQKKEIDSLAFWELLSGDTITAIECTIDSIELKFCLLNKNGVSATKFKEGEGFSFYFKMTNHCIEELCVYSGISGLSCNKELGDVKTLDHKTIIEYVPVECDLSYKTYPFYGEKSSIELINPWYYDPEDGCCYGPYENIPKGKYYTQFTHVFEYVLWDDTPILLLGPLTFRINFEIE